MDPLSGVRTADRAALARRLAELDAAVVPAGDARRAEWAQRVARSAAEVRTRRAALPVPKFDQRLPILERRAEIAGLIERHQVVVICGETGSGKTTQLAQICLALGRGAAGMIAHTQPRRIAARSVAARIASELGVRLGDAVGVKVRFSDQTSERTALKLMTDGMLLAETAGDRELSAYDTIIIDEAHERSLNIDFLLGYLKRLLPRRPDLKLIITSATIDPGRFSDHFGGRSVAPVVEVSGRTYPVEVRYRPVSPRDHEFDEPQGVDASAVADAVLDVMIPGGTGDALVFLPGEREIRECEAALRRERIDAEVLPLYARLSSQEQDRVFSPGDRRRVLLATNVAETSLTVPNIRFVVDTGQARINRYDARAGVQRLPVEWVSRASAAQRAGRCGRVSAGVCVRLYSERLFAERPAFTEPEIQRSGLASVILQMKALDLGPIDQFEFLDAPDARAVQTGCDTLFELGAIDEATPAARITTLGRRLARVPLDPHIARMLLAGHDEGALREVTVLAAGLSIQDPRERPAERREAADAAHRTFAHPESDFLSLLTIWEHFREAGQRMGSGELRDWCRANFLNHARMREWVETAAQLRDVCEDLELEASRGAASADAVHRALLTGLIGHLCCKEDGSSHEYRGARGTSVSIHPGSTLFKKGPRWFMAAELVETTRLYARTCAKIEPEWIEELAGHVLTRSVGDAHFDMDAGRASAWERATLRGLVVVPRRRVPLAPADAPRARAMFIERWLCAPDEVNAAALADGPLARLVAANDAVFRAARGLEARLRRRDVLRPATELSAWFQRRLPPTVVDRDTLSAWLETAGASAVEALTLRVPDVLAADAVPTGMDVAEAFPDAITVSTPGGPVRCAVQYAFEPGKDGDGVTIDAPLLALAALTAERLEWTVPGMLADKVLALLKQTPKAHRAALETYAGGLSALARDASDLMAFGVGALPAALSETVDGLVTPSPNVPMAAWPLAAVPEALRVRVRVLDEQGKELGKSRSLEDLRSRFASRIAQAQAAAARAMFDRGGIVTWDFAELPALTPDSGDSADGPRFAALVDRGDSAAFTLLHDRARAAAHTRRGVRRLLALAVREEAEPLIDALPDLDAMGKWYTGLGGKEDVRDAVLCLTVERVFMASQAPVTTRAMFEERLATQRGRLAPVLFDTGQAIARTLESRAKIAHRLGAGTPRLWAASIGDIREQAAYLMPEGFLGLIEWEQFQHYPRYVSAIQERLARLREDGSGVETDALAAITPVWKKFTGWVARAMASAADVDASASADKAGGAKGRSKAALPSNRRTVATVNVDAGVWALQPGALPEPVARLRWGVEQARVRVFSAAGVHTGHPEVSGLSQLAAAAGL